MSLENLNAAVAAMNAATARIATFMDGNDAELAARLAAYDDLAGDLAAVVDATLTPTFYVDGVSGDDANSGSTAGEALETFAAAIAKCAPGVHAKINLAKDQVHNLTDCLIHNAYVEVAAYGSGTENPILSGLYDGSHPSEDRSGNIRAENTVLYFVDVDLRTPIAVRTGGQGAGIIHSNSTVTVRTLRSNIELGDFHLAYNQKSYSPINVGLYHSDISRLAGYTQESKVMLSAVGAIATANTSVPGGTTLADFVNIVRNGEGEAVNVIANSVL